MTGCAGDIRRGPSDRNGIATFLPNCGFAGIVPDVGTACYLIGMDGAADRGHDPLVAIDQPLMAEQIACRGHVPIPLDQIDIGKVIGTGSGGGVIARARRTRSSSDVMTFVACVPVSARTSLLTALRMARPSLGRIKFAICWK